MYGLINLAIEEAILANYRQFWDLIKQSCRSYINDTDGTFISRLYYDDELTYRLLDASEKILNCEKYGHVSVLFGEKFYDIVSDSGYEGILKLMGENLKEFLDNLDSFHTHLRLTYSRMKPPSFRTSYKFNEQTGEREENILILHYYSDRVGLEGIVMGMVKAAARELHSMEIAISIHKLKHVDQGIDHTEFLIEVKGPAVSKKNQVSQGCLRESNSNFNENHNIELTETKSNPTETSSEGQQLRENLKLSNAFIEDDTFSYKSIKQLNENALIDKVSPLVFAQALPFHLIFDRELIIRQAGTSILRIVPELNKNKQVRLTDIMNMLEPQCLKGKLSFENILKYINCLYVFRPDEKQVISGGHRHLQGEYLKNLMTANNTIQEKGTTVDNNNNKDKDIELLLSKLDSSSTINSKGKERKESDELSKCELPMEDIDKYIVQLRGQMSYMANNDLMLFICSPSVANLDDLNNTGLFLSDIPLHDATRDLVLLSEQFEAEYKVQKKLTSLTEQLNVMKNELEEEKNKTDRLLYSVLPPLVANELRNNRPVPAKRFQPVTILFSGIIGFSDFCARNSDSSGAIRIVNLLNKIYTTFDVLTEPKRNPYVYKVETVGDKYMAVSGLPEACDSHARHINKLALDIFDLAKTIKLEEYTGIKIKPLISTDSSAIRSSSSSATITTNNLQRQQTLGATTLGEVKQQAEFTQMDQCEHLRVTIGVHCGEVVTGVIGKRTPRYCLFGNTVNLTSRCETTGKKGSINVSQDVYNLCTNNSNNFDPEFEFTYRGQINMKGKSEPMGMWLLNRRSLL